MATTAKFWDKHAVGYSKRPIADEDAYRKKLAITREYFTPESEVFEFGCGTGGTAILHAPYVKHVHATDISEKMLEFGREKAKDANIDNVTFEQLVIDDYEVADGSYDAVLGMSILHLLEDKEVVIDKVWRMLKPGGVFVSSTMCLGDSHKWFRFVGPVMKAIGVFPLVRAFTAEELKASIQWPGFSIEREWRPGPKAAVFLVARKPA